MYLIVDQKNDKEYIVVGVVNQVGDHIKHIE
jgi:hypothetical protein